MLSLHLFLAIQKKFLPFRGLCLNQLLGMICSHQVLFSRSCNIYLQCCKHGCACMHRGELLIHRGDGGAECLCSISGLLRAGDGVPGHQRSLPAPVGHAAAAQARRGAQQEAAGGRVLVRPLVFTPKIEVFLAAAPSLSDHHHRCQYGNMEVYTCPVGMLPYWQELQCKLPLGTQTHRGMKCLVRCLLHSPFQRSFA